MERKICSACLLGVNCRWDGKKKPNEKVMELARKEFLIPLCPEQLGGLSTPREPAVILGKKVFTKDSGKDITENFVRGSLQTLLIAKVFGVKKAILKQRSPSCGSGKIYDENRNIIPGNGITTDRLQKEGIEVISEEDLL